MLKYEISNKEAKRYISTIEDADNNDWNKLKEAKDIFKYVREKEFKEEPEAI